ncbi:MAG: hypothetical protein WC655_13870 [Candidatus Hydrogenedentales bacterium]
MLQQIQSYCDKVCTMHGLDDVREELQDHFEDKMIAYLSCGEKLQEQDAFLLVREHFGDPAALKSMFQTVHVKEAGVTLGRRICAAFAVALFLCAITQAMFLVTSVLIHMWQPTPEMRLLISVAYGNFIMTLFPVALYLILRRWNRRLSMGAPVWFTRMPMPSLLRVLAALILFERLVPTLGWGVMSRPIVAGGVSHPVEILLMILGLLAFAAQGVVWMWWVDRAPRTKTALVAALACLCAMTILATGSFSIFPGLGIIITETEGASDFGYLALTLMSDSATHTNYILTLDMPRLFDLGMLQARGTTLLISLAAVAVALSAYLVMRRIADRRLAQQ